MESNDGPSKDDSANSQPQRPPTPEEKDDSNPASKKATRKRTKTGCLTCRKRRIKCDEGRPTCNNCLKSKRQCDGYNQRVIFKDPLGAFAGAPYGPIHYPAPSPQALVREQQLTAAQQRSSSQALQIIAPKPPTVGYPQLIGSQFSHVFSGPTGPQPMQFDPGQFGSQPPPPKFTFFPPTTADAFSRNQNQWRQESSTNSDQTPSTSGTKNAQNDTHVVSPQPSRTLEKKGKSTEEAEPVGRIIEPEPEEWEYADDSEDDASMAQSDDEPILSQRDSQFSLHQLGAMMSQRADQPYHMFGTHPRTFSTYAAEDLLATYDPTPANSPLNDKQVASIFWHFINVTGPTISLFERHPFDPSHLFQGQSVPKARQHIWIYTFPVLSLSHPALLQAILAIASLQIAKLQGVPPTASLKHYHLALRRIAKNVARPARRAQLSNLAATLLLAFYEVWNSDHDKWSRHLLGSRWIIKDIPYVEMTRAMMSLKLQRRQREMEQAQMDGFDGFPPYEEPGPLHRDWDQIDVPLLSILTGRDLTYDDFGMIPGASSYPTSKNYYTERDMEKYEHLSDLFWWHCKMDVYQSILGGTRLFLETEVWTQCPPRAPMGRLDAVWGTYDHLMLLLSRVANFSSRDLARKREVLRANGPSGPGGPGGPGGPPPGMFAGMMPASEKVTMPMGFSPPRETTPPSDASQDMDLDTRTAEAYREWDEIRQAFEELKNHFGPDFEPLGTDIYPAADTPFGIAAHYRTYSVAGVWMNYYMGLIVLHRAHPMMPPVAMMAAGLSARTTAHYAMELGRIAAGMEENISQLAAVSTLMGAALIECAFPLFVAGIQYQEDSQRHWLIQRLYDIARLTGWQSARQIAEGCESAWCKTAQMGRGPPYQRSSNLDRNFGPDHAIWGNPRRIDRRIREVYNGDDSRDWDNNKDHQSDSNNHTSSHPSRKIVLAKGEKAFYAMGLLAVEQDLERLDLDEGESKAL
ncbi:hypothetical protein F4809DRAFT_49498 [Biscogniauxia mediterranea]|nr:hypothetical protein F4809DRAFT_49498 [Biscogniauxia mediterranea]